MLRKQNGAWGSIHYPCMRGHVAVGQPIRSLIAKLPRRPSLYASVVTGVILVCAALLALDGWHTWQARATALANDKAETANLASSLAQHVHDTIQSVDSILLGFRERVETDGLTPAALARLHRVMAATVADVPQVHGLFLYDANGDWLATSLQSVLPGLNNSDRDYFKYHQSHVDPGLFVGRPVHSKSDGSWISPSPAASMTRRALSAASCWPRFRSTTSTHSTQSSMSAGRASST